MHLPSQKPCFCCRKTGLGPEKCFGSVHNFYQLLNSEIDDVTNLDKQIKHNQKRKIVHNKVV